MAKRQHQASGRTKPVLIQTTVQKLLQQQLKTAAEKEGLAVATYVRRILLRWAEANAKGKEEST